MPPVPIEAVCALRSTDGPNALRDCAEISGSRRDHTQGRAASWRAAPGTRFRRSRSRAELGDPRDEPRYLAAGAVLVQDPLLGRTHDLRFGFLHHHEGAIAVAGGDRLLDPAHIIAHARAARLVDDRAPRDLARGLLGGFGIGHGRSSSASTPLPASLWCFSENRGRRASRGALLIVRAAQGVNAGGLCCR